MRQPAIEINNMEDKVSRTSHSDEHNKNGIYREEWKKWIHPCYRNANQLWLQLWMTAWWHARCFQLLNYFIIYTENGLARHTFKRKKWWMKTEQMIRWCEEKACDALPLVCSPLCHTNFTHNGINKRIWMRTIHISGWRRCIVYAMNMDWITIYL